ncbi:MAG TPA: hypothetical protein VFL30_05530 [Rhodanobacteraceae bacterium]|nr:hypothetical protein [Rhodanobacteraceae bacterium]
MRRTLILTIAALAGLLLVLLMLVRAPEPRTAAALPKPAVHAPPPVQTVAAPPAEPVASKPVEPVAKPAEATEKKPPDPPKPTIAALEKPADADEPPADGADESGEDSEPEDSGPPPIDTDHATDLLADMIARQETESEGDHLPNTAVQTLKKFNDESADANWSENAEQHIEAALDAWIGALPEDAQAHLALIHVECRESLCQVLAADNDPGSESERSQAGHDWQQAVSSLTQQPWWHELGFVDLTTQVSGADGHTLYMSFLLRELKAPASETPPDTGAPDGG